MDKVMKLTCSKKDMKLLESICQKIFDKSGFNILTLDVKELGAMTDYFIIAEGNVQKHVQALAKALLELLDEEGMGPCRMEGYSEGDWVVIDVIDVVIHLFTPEMRIMYELEDLWKEAEIVDVPINTAVVVAQRGKM